MKKEKLLTIGQFASMHGINKKTLMWYDEIGLFGPATINQTNGYRYYNYHQSPILETILLLRELDVSINEIQYFMKNRCQFKKPIRKQTNRTRPEYYPPKSNSGNLMQPPSKYGYSADYGSIRDQYHRKGRTLFGHCRN